MSLLQNGLEREDGERTVAELEKQGRELETKWQSSTIKNKCFEAKRPFKQSFSENNWSTETAKIRTYGDHLKLTIYPPNLVSNVDPLCERGW